MKNEYRISESINEITYNTVYRVQMKYGLFGWITIKVFEDNDMSFAKREAEELLDKLK